MISVWLANQGKINKFDVYLINYGTRLQETIPTIDNQSMRHKYDDNKENESIQTTKRWYNKQNGLQSEKIAMSITV